MADINPILKPATTTTLRDYRHAARIFVDDNYRLSPKYGFLFYVEFDFNPLITNISNLAARELGMIVKSVNLPKYTVDTKVHNAYNRKNIVQNSIKYDPISIIFHDDQSDNVRNFWYDYYNFFFRDPDYADSTYSAPHKYQGRPTYDWGYSPKPSVGYNNVNGNQPYQYIQAIRIYSLYQKNFSEYELINPTITMFKHGEHVNGDNTTMSHEMTVQFETVKYHTGYVTSNTVGDFIDLHYDRTRSPIVPVGAENLVADGQGGVSRASDTIVDLASTNMTLSQMTGIADTTSFISSGAFANTYGSSTNYASIFGGSANAGGFSIPNLGSLASGIPSTSVVQQQLVAGAAGLAGTVTGQAVNAVVGGVAAGLGKNGTAIVGLAASVLTNPKLALKTVENMAITYAMSYATSKVLSVTTPLFSELGNKIATAVGDLKTTVSNQIDQLGGIGSDITPPLASDPSSVDSVFGASPQDFSSIGNFETAGFGTTVGGPMDLNGTITIDSFF